MGNFFSTGSWGEGNAKPANGEQPADGEQAANGEQPVNGEPTAVENEATNEAVANEPQEVPENAENAVSFNGKNSANNSRANTPKNNSANNSRANTPKNNGANTPKNNSANNSRANTPKNNGANTPKNNSANNSRANTPKNNAAANAAPEIAEISDEEAPAAANNGNQKKTTQSQTQRWKKTWSA